MTRPDLDALAALLDKATPGPWATNGGRVECRDDHGWVNDGWIIGDLDGPDAEANSALIVAAVNALPELIARVRELEREREPRRDLGGSTHWDIADAGAVCHDECAVAQIKGAALAMRERCAQLLNITRSDAQLMAGDMTAGEWRTVSAVLRNRAAAIRGIEA